MSVGSDQQKHLCISVGEELVELACSEHICTLQS